MKKGSTYIVVLLLAVFAVTFVPFNVLHHHAENEHAAMVLAHHDDPTHHCALDDFFCQQDIGKDCGHETHIQQTITKCFSCAFHFIKVFDSQEQYFTIGLPTAPITFQVFMTPKQHRAMVLLSNKGPPRLA